MEAGTVPIPPPPPPPPATPAKRGLGFWLAVWLAVVFFGSTCLMGLVVVGLLASHPAILGGAVKAHTKTFTEVTVKGKGEDKILLLPIRGLITSQPTRRYFQDLPSMVHMVKAQFDQAQKDPKIKAVVIPVDSPGGGITASDVLYKRVEDFKKKSKAKVVVLMEDIAASGGYYVAAPAHRIVAHPTTLTGSIGVIMPLVNVAELAKRWGIKQATIKSGEMKDIGSAMRDMSPKEREVLQSIIDEMYDRFITIVATHRALPKEEVARLADGRVYTGLMAQKLGLVDDIGYLEDALAIASKLANIRDYKLVRYRRELSFADLLGSVGEAALGPKRVELSFGSQWGSAGYCPQYLWSPDSPLASEQR